QVVLAPDAQARAATILAGLPQPFTTAEARQALGTTRRVAIPLLEYLDRTGITQRLPDDRRRLRLSPFPRPSARGPAPPADASGPPAVPALQPSGVQDLRLDVADRLPGDDGGQAAAVDPHRAAHGQPVQRRPARARQVLDLCQVDDLGVPGVGEPGPLVKPGD